MENNLTQVLKELQNLNKKVDGIDKKVDKLEAEQQFMRAEQQSMRTEQQSMRDEQQSMNTEQQTMKSMLIAQGDHIHQLIQIVGATNAHISQIKDDVSEIKNTQQDHQRALERLSFRSITQEADLDDLRRIK